MSRITADVIDVLENEKTRVEILDIDGVDAGEYVEGLGHTLYQHKLEVSHATAGTLFITFMSKVGTPYQSFTGIPTDKIVGLTLSVNTGFALLSGAVESYLNVFGSVSLSGWYINNGDIVTISSGAITFVSDTVSEV